MICRMMNGLLMISRLTRRNFQQGEKPVSDIQNEIDRKNATIIAANDYTAVRRKVHEVTDPAWIKAVLHEGAFGMLATSHADQPFLNANNYVYDEAANVIYFHRSKVGRTSATLAQNPRVCYSVSEMGQLYSGASAMNFGVAYRSVIIFGTAALVDDQAEVQRALQMLMDKYAPHLTPGVDYENFTPRDAAATAVYKITIEQWSGKQRDLPADKLTYDFPPDEA